MEFYSQPEVLIFTWAGLLLMLLAGLELFSLLFGFAFSQIFDNLFPDLDVDTDLDLDLDTDADLDLDLDVDTDADISFSGSASGASAILSFLAWLNLGKVPMLMAIGFFLMFFSLGGIISQQLLTNIGIGPVTAWIMGPAVFFAIMPLFKAANAGFGKIIPKDSTMAVSTKTFIGRVATITIGTATSERPAEAKLYDQHDHAHYVMVYSDNKDEDLPQGEHVLIVGRKGAHFAAILNPNPNLEDPSDT